jgi:hypothetical protein
MALSNAKLELICCCPAALLSPTAEIPADRIAARSSAISGRATSKALLVYLVNHDLAHSPQCRLLTDAGKQSRLAEEVSGREAVDFLQVGIVFALLPDDDTCPNDHQRRQRFTL